MIDIMYKTANDIDFPLIFRLDAQAFNRPFDTAFKNVEELKKLLKGTTIEIAYDQKTPIGYYSHTHNRQ